MLIVKLAPSLLVLRKSSASSHDKTQKTPPNIDPCSLIISFCGAMRVPSPSRILGTIFVILFESA